MTETSALTAQSARLHDTKLNLHLGLRCQTSAERIYHIITARWSVIDALLIVYTFFLTVGMSSWAGAWIWRHHVESLYQRQSATCWRTLAVFASEVRLHVYLFTKISCFTGSSSSRTSIYRVCIKVRCFYMICWGVFYLTNKTFRRFIEDKVSLKALLVI